LCAVVLIATSVPCHAGERIGIGVKVGTLGYGLDVTGRIVDWFSVRGSVNAIDVSRSYESSDIDYDGDLELGAYGVLLDFHPFRGDFRITAGLMRNRNEISLTADPSDDVEIGDTTYTPAQVGTLRGGVEFNKVAPYFGIGIGSAADGPGRIKFVLDVGALKQGSGDATLDASSSQVSRSDLKEEEDDIEDKISNYRYWPVIALGISVRI